MVNNSWRLYCHDAAILIYLIQTQPESTWLALHARCHLFFPPHPFLPCIINKWHLDFIKVPRPPWQYNVAGGHFNISLKRLGSYYVRQAVAPEEDGARKEVPCLKLLLPGRLCDARKHTTVLNKPKCIHSQSQVSLIFFIPRFLASILYSQID